MVYCTAEDVRRIIHTGLSDADLESIIELGDAEIERRIGAQDASDPVIRKLSALIAASTVKTRQPDSSAAGEYREETGGVQGVWSREIEAIFRLYSGFKVAASGYGFIDEDKRTEKCL